MLAARRRWGISWTREAGRVPRARAPAGEIDRLSPVVP